MSYPKAEIQLALDEMTAWLENDSSVSHQHKKALLGFLDSYRNADLMAWQQAYVELFDRGRNLSLHLFEHIHGESRDRGQAMVELMKVYQINGFEVTARELPDFIPLYLEYLSQRPHEEAIGWLRGALPVLSLLGVRLTERGSPYAVLFDVLSGLTGDESVDTAALRELASAEGPDETLLRMDEIWEEEAVSFMGNPGACQTKPNDAHPIKFTSRNDGAVTLPT